ncbi:MAG TPA: glycosyltransferase [Steroidobacteraceae bacterium]|nr:glycosyltransferase [Steroidobacteraceae bacterium]
MLVVAFPAFADSSLNPYNSLLYAQLQAQGQPVAEFGWRRVVRLQLADILHVHWPERQILTPGWRLRKIGEFVLFRLYLRAIRLRGGKVVWTAHNAFPHDKPRTPLNLFLWTRFLARLDGVIYLSEESRRQIQADYPVLSGKKSAVIQHGDYLEWLAKMLPRAARDRFSRQSLGIPAGAKVILSFGLIRPYKGIDLLVEEFKHLNDDTHLIIAGYTSRPELRQRIEELARGQPQIHLLLRWVEGEELAALLELSDMVVLPYRTITNSGAALLALSAQLPILGPNMGSIPELQQLVGTQWVRLFDGEISQSQLREAVAWLATSRQAPNMEPFSWPGIATETLALYRSLTSR